eukprot:m.27118 g.27118  ORF g.27118 m.27118 type:complete len:735 (+) comp5914_c0_seq2:50-2254(+)
MESMATRRWDTSKENMRPVRSGYKASVVEATGQSIAEEELSKQHKEFEALILASGGNDPVATWARYIEWAEIRTNNADYAVDVTSIMQKCINRLVSLPEAKESMQFLQICLKYMDTCENPLDVMSFLYNKSACIIFPQFWKAWATYFEHAGEVEKAEETLRTGRYTMLEHNDRKLLEVALENLQARIEQGYTRQATSESDRDEQDAQVDENGRPNARKTLNELPRTKKGKIPVNRAMTSRTPRGLRSGPIASTASAPKTSNHGALSIFSDGGSSKLSVPVHTRPNEKLWQGMPTDARVSKENTKAATTWNGGIGGNKGFSDAPLAVFTNIASPQPQEQKKAKKSKPKALKQKKITERKEVVNHVAERGFNQKFQEKGKKFMMRYKPVAMYPNATTEYSFEELQAQAWLAREGFSMCDFPPHQSLTPMNKIVFKEQPQNSSQTKSQGNDERKVQTCSLPVTASKALEIFSDVDENTTNFFELTPTSNLMPTQSATQPLSRTPLHHPQASFHILSDTHQQLSPILEESREGSFTKNTSTATSVTSSDGKGAMLTVSEYHNQLNMIPINELGCDSIRDKPCASFSVGEALPHIVPKMQFKIWKQLNNTQYLALEVGEDEDDDDAGDGRLQERQQRIFHFRRESSSASLLDDLHGESQSRFTLKPRQSRKRRHSTTAETTSFLGRSKDDLEKIQLLRQRSSTSSSSPYVFKRSSSSKASSAGMPQKRAFAHITSSSNK